MTPQTVDCKKIRQQASEWAVLLADSEAGLELHGKFERWLMADTRHAEAYADAAQVFSVVGDIDDPALLKLADPQYAGDGIFHKISRWIVLSWHSLISGVALPNIPRGVAVGLAVAMGVMSLVGVSMVEFSNVRTYSTETAEILEIRLADGSQVTLGARSQIDVLYSEEERRVTLLNGEAFFAVEKDKSRPFFVLSNGTQIQVVGTKFNVHKGPAGLRVAVEEGIVEVSIPHQETPEARVSIPADDMASFVKPDVQSTEKTEVALAPKAVLAAGEQIISDHEGVLSDIKANDSTALPSAWRDGRLIYSNARFSELVADINRYYEGHIGLGSKEVGDMRISGVFWTSKINDLIEALPEYLPVELQNKSDDLIIIMLRSDQNQRYQNQGR
ncbi:MAG: FecR domain-containing protein [Kordiimonadaceae bacterium]|nr:FecR domain-containing protein [Kordiimonadaceae bacterium]